MKYKSKIFTFIALICVTNFANSLELHLQCYGDLLFSQISRPDERKSGNILVDVLDVDRGILIIASGLLDAGVDTIQENEFQIFNYSDKSRWNIRNIYDTGKTNSNVNRFITNITLDRNTGLIDIKVVGEMKSGLDIRQHFLGSCSKIDSSNKKF